MKRNIGLKCPNTKKNLLLEDKNTLWKIKYFINNKLILTHQKNNCLLSTLLTDKITSSERITVVNGNDENAEILNIFFLNRSRKSKIIDYISTVFLANNISHQIRKLLCRQIYHSRDDCDDDYDDTELFRAMICHGKCDSLISFPDCG